MLDREEEHGVSGILDPGPEVRPLMREISPFGLRMPAQLRQQLQAQARGNNRSLNAEILARLQASLAPSRRSSRELNQPVASYSAHGDTERAMLDVFRRLPPEKQLALLSLFK